MKIGASDPGQNQVPVDEWMINHKGQNADTQYLEAALSKHLWLTEWIFTPSVSRYANQ